MGSAFALACAFFWAFAVILFKKAGESFSPIALNIYKSVVAMVLIGMTMLVMGIPFFPDAAPRVWWLLILSGLFGVTLADIFYFSSLNHLGAGMVAVVECLYLPCVLVFSYILLGERMGFWGIIGSTLVLCAILVGAVSLKDLTSGNFGRGQNMWGICAGVLAMMFVALGIVIAKDVLDQADVFWATFVRVTAGLVGLVPIVLCHPERMRFVRELKFSKAWLNAFPATVSGNYIALVLWLAGMKYTTASKAAVLNQMSTIFIFILATVWLKEKMTAQRLAAIFLAVTGAYLVIFN
ncbi:DMT family transporter [uncultured Desulfobacter sp.]|uniref:DMT family transporter n=1 Tax=uncultured Desulfobacter sp. TaxID=240139 RepID=UPI0029F4D4DE|nr:DMT family transporter [uncultured Desulfobacter sp.]